MLKWSLTLQIIVLCAAHE